MVHERSDGHDLPHRKEGRMEKGAGGGYTETKGGQDKEMMDHALERNLDDNAMLPNGPRNVLDLEYGKMMACITTKQEFVGAVREAGLYNSVFHIHVVLCFFFSFFFSVI